MEVLSSIGDGSIQLAWQDFEPTAQVPRRGDLLLITGWFSDCTLWPAALCEALAQKGYRVVRYDHRDSGLSTRPLPGAQYTLDTLADDAAALLDAIRIESAHVAGVAMGGTVAQLMALRHPHRVRSLTLIGCSTGSRRFPPPDSGVGALNRQAIPPGEAERRAHRRTLFEAMSAGCFEADAEDARENESLGRGAATANAERQLRAVAAAGDRRALLATVNMPALVVVGRADPLVSAESAAELVAALPNARLQIVDGMGHGIIPRPLFQPLADAIASLTATDRSR